MIQVQFQSFERLETRVILYNPFFWTTEGHLKKHLYFTKHRVKILYTREDAKDRAAWRADQVTTG